MLSGGVVTLGNLATGFASNKVHLSSTDRALYTVHRGGDASHESVGTANRTALSEVGI